MANITYLVPKLVVLVTIAFVIVGAEVPPANRIVGGADANIGEFPYQVSLRLNHSHACGGTIIGKRHILTAGHCIHGLTKNPVADITVVTGTNSVSPGAGVIHSVKTVKVHPHYSTDVYQSWKNDIAVISLTKNIVFDMATRSIPLSVKNITEHMTCRASGWGVMSFPVSVKPNNLRKAVMTTITNKECERRHTDVKILEGHLCAVASPGTGLCSGDSGGPLSHEGEIVGVASFVDPCAKGVPDVFTRISLYLDFVKEAVAST